SGQGNRPPTDRTTWCRRAPPPCGERGPGTRVCGVVLLRDDVGELALAGGAEAHRAVGQREQRVVAATTDVATRVDLGPALADDDRAGRHDLAAEALDAE